MSNIFHSFRIIVIEDFSGSDFFMILPKAWFDTKLFVDDYTSIGIFIAILIILPTILTLIVIRRRKIKQSTIR
jgi:hypothetical protein